MNGYARVCVWYTRWLLQHDDCGSSSGNVYNDTTITTVEVTAAVEAMAGNNNAKRTQFKRRWIRLKFQYSLFIFDTVARLHNHQIEL